MICINYCSIIIIIFTSISWSYYYIINWSKFKYFFLWSYRGRRSNFISTLILIFWSSRSIYFNFTWVWDSFSYYFSRKKKKRNIWSFRDNLCNNFNWIFRIYCMSSSYIYCRNRSWYTSLFYISNYNYCNSYRN